MIGRIYLLWYSGWCFSYNSLNWTHWVPKIHENSFIFIGTKSNQIVFCFLGSILFLPLLLQLWLQQIYQSQLVSLDGGGRFIPDPFILNHCADILQRGHQAPLPLWRSGGFSLFHIWCVQVRSGVELSLFFHQEGRGGRKKYPSTWMIPSNYKRYDTSEET